MPHKHGAAYVEMTNGFPWFMLVKRLAPCASNDKNSCGTGSVLHGVDEMNRTSMQSNCRDEVKGKARSLWRYLGKHDYEF